MRIRTELTLEVHGVAPRGLVRAWTCACKAAGAAWYNRVKKISNTEGNGPQGPTERERRRAYAWGSRISNFERPVSNKRQRSTTRG